MKSSTNPVTTVVKRLILSADGPTSRGPGALSLLLVVLMAGCGSPDEGTDTGRVNVAPAEDGGAPSDTGSPDGAIDGATDTVADTASDGETNGGGGDADSGDADGVDQLCAGERCMDDEVCHDEQCVSKAEAQCQGAADKGTVAPGGSRTLSGSFDGSALDGLATSCAASDQAPERVFQFTASADSIIEMSSSWTGGGGAEAKVEFRRGGCRSASAEESACYDEDRRFWASKGEVFYAVVEDDGGAGGSFELELSATAAACKPDETTCTQSGQREVCELQAGSPTPVNYTCPADQCASGACKGASCAEPISVSGTGTHTFSGDLYGFDRNMSFGNNSKCLIGAETVDSKGREVVFAVDLKKGETLSVDTSNDSVDNLAYIGTTCHSQADAWDCVAAEDVEPNPMTFDAPAKGTYHLVVDAWSFADSGQQFDYRLTIK